MSFVETFQRQMDTRAARMLKLINVFNGNNEIVKVTDTNTSFIIVQKFEAFFTFCGNLAIIILIFKYTQLKFLCLLRCYE